MMTGRVGMIVWLYHLKHVKALRKYGNIHYVSKKMKYAVLYCDEDNSENIMRRLQKQRFTRRIDPSLLQEVPTHYKKKTENTNPTESASPSL
ncbi:UPF0298 protein [Pullulanibacillus camelliae]|uniref:UPF0298 protein GCM10011391_19890 n=1 Tax=Pullulanibacillus camelliae TaxID=1707096 RepID=A0A8J2VVI4_9BACL|nr:YlbG family protein [Pullulanibacillus camelliae]GGE41145.1 UPF0298 protein [Pullulanibacillus camelliae]